MAGDAKSSIISISIGLRIKKIREERFGNANICAEKYGVKAQKWSKMEKGKVRFSAEDIFSLASFFYVSPIWLLTGIEPVSDDTGIDWEKLTKDTPLMLATWPAQPIQDELEAKTTGELLTEWKNSPSRHQDNSWIPNIYTMTQLGGYPAPSGIDRKQNALPTLSPEKSLAELHGETNNTMKKGDMNDTVPVDVHREMMAELKANREWLQSEINRLNAELAAVTAERDSLKALFEAKATRKAGSV